MGIPEPMDVPHTSTGSNHMTAAALIDLSLLSACSVFLVTRTNKLKLSELMRSVKFNKVLDINFFKCNSSNMFAPFKFSIIFRVIVSIEV